MDRWRGDGNRPRSERLLEEFTQVTGRAQRPARPPRSGSRWSSLAGDLLVGGAVAAIVFAVLAAAWASGLGQPPSNSVGDLGPPTPSIAPSMTPSMTPIPSPSPTVSPTPTPTPAPTGSPSPTPTASPVPLVADCVPSGLTAHVLDWQGAAGARIANVQVTNRGTAACGLPLNLEVRLVDATGGILIDSGNDTARSRARLDVAGGTSVTTAVRATNYCGAAPSLPVTVAFVLSDGRQLTASAAASDEAVPPCEGSTAPTIAMNGWRR